MTKCVPRWATSSPSSSITRSSASAPWSPQRQDEHWTVSAIGAPNIGERSEKEIISAFVNRIAELEPQLVTFNGASFDLPVLRYRAMVCGVAAPGLAARPYFNRYTEDAIDLCDVLSSFSSQNKPSLHELCRVMGLPGKPDGINGADVERYCREGRVAEVAAYCETDVVNTYRVWLRYELFRGRLTENGLQASEASLRDYIRARGDVKLHLAYVLAGEKREASGFDCRPEARSKGGEELLVPDVPGV